MINLKFKKVVRHYLLLLRCQKQKFRSSQAHSWNPIPPFQCYFSQSVWCVCVCVFCLFTPFLSALFVFHRKNLVFSHLMYRYTTWVIFKKKRYWKVNFWYYWIIQYNTDSCCKHMADDVNIYLYGCVNLLVWVCCVSLCVCVCVMSNQSTSKKPHYVSGVSKFDALLHRTYINVVLLLRYQGSTFIGP